MTSVIPGVKTSATQRTVLGRLPACALALCAATLSGWSGTIGAAGVAEESGLEEVVVTARRSSESLQTTPIAITAVTATHITELGMTSVNDVSHVAPNVQLQQGGGNAGKSVIAFIRGVGQFDANPAYEPGVGFYINDVYQGNLFGSLFDVTDVERVEVLRGPQGTLFGKNNEGGAIRIFTPVPKGDGSGNLAVGFGSYQRRQVKGAADMSLIPDTLFLRIAGGVNSTVGYVNLVDFVCANPTLSGTLPRTAPESQKGNCITGHMGGDTIQTGRADLRWLAHDGLEVNLSGDVTDNKGEPGAEILIHATPAAAGNFTVGGVTWDNRFVPPDHYTNYATYTDPTNGKTFPRVSNVRTWGTSGKVDWDASSAVHIKNILAYRTFDGEYTQIWGEAPVHINDNYYKPYHRQLTDELAANGTIDKLDWTAGLYYYKAHTELNANIYMPEFPAPGGLPGRFQFYGEDPVDDKDRSVFMHLDYHFTDKLSADGGLRYSKESKEYTFYRIVPTSPGQPQLYLPGFNPSVSRESDASNLDYRAALQYQWTAALMTYGDVATGFKGPGINPRPNVATDVKPFSKETVRTYELGAKTQWLDNALRLNVAGYFSDYRDLQLRTIVGGGTTAASNFVTNTGRVYISGVEAELDAEPVHELLINASVGTLKYDIRDLGAAATAPGGPRYGNKGSYAPSLKYNVGAQYGISIGSAGRIIPRLDYYYQSKMYTSPDNAPGGLIDAYGVANAHLTFESADKGWALSAECKNLANKFYYVTKSNLEPQAGMLVGVPSLPRTFFFEVRRTF